MQPRSQVSVGRVGENPGNEVAGRVVSSNQVKNEFNNVETAYNASTRFDTTEEKFNQAFIFSSLEP